MLPYLCEVDVWPPVLTVQKFGGTCDVDTPCPNKEIQEQPERTCSIVHRSSNSNSARWTRNPHHPPARATLYSTTAALMVSVFSFLIISEFYNFICILQMTYAGCLYTE